MAETLGSLCDKLTILILKHWHSEDPVQLSNVELQQHLLKEEIDQYFQAALNGLIPLECLDLPANKVYRKPGNEIPQINGDIGQLFERLAFVNCKLWHCQEKVYDFENVPLSEKDRVIKELALLNLERNQCIDAMNLRFYQLVQNTRSVR